MFSVYSVKRNMFKHSKNYHNEEDTKLTSCSLFSWNEFPVKCFERGTPNDGVSLQIWLDQESAEW